MPENRSQIFVKIDEYRDVLDVLNLTKEKLNEAREILNTIMHLKNEEDTEIENWHSELEEIEKKISFLDKTLFEIDSR
jgi:predicted nuclease with TOPRIM domain